jgi:predicted GIY-YIG superfamily endonuclease
LSRYALEWAKQQVPGDPAAKTILLLLADRAEGAKHHGSVVRARLAQEASLAYGDAQSAADRLQQRGLLEIGGHDPRSDIPSVPFHLRIPAEWRCQASAPPRRDADPEDRPTAVYRLYDEEGCLLYVGISDRPETRFGEHERDKYWWREVATREVVWYPSRRLAQAEEYRAITLDRPEFNVQDSKQSCVLDRVERAKRRRYVVANSRLGAFEKTVARIREDVESHEFDRDVLPPVDQLADRYMVDPTTVHQALRWLADHMIVVRVSDFTSLANWRER